jgi:hypothetical protein
MSQAADHVAAAVRDVRRENGGGGEYSERCCSDGNTHFGHLISLCEIPNRN